jgi:gamma-glutamylputrescine oxidase
VVLEAHRVGWGASGRNGGQVGTGFNWYQKKLEGRIGYDAARTVWDVAEEGKRQLREFCKSEAPDARYLPAWRTGNTRPARRGKVGRTLSTWPRPMTTT